MNELSSWVRESFLPLANPDKAREMAAYMKTDMPFYGIQKPARAVLQRELKKRFKPTSEEEYRSAVLDLWTQPHREEKYVAIFVARTYKTWITPACLDLYEQLLREGAWWDFVDEICVNLVGQLHREHRSEIQPIMDQWIDDHDRWIRRSAILCQLKHKAETDEEVLFSYCLQRCHETEFFIRKAIGWALREYSKTAPEAVAWFLQENQDQLSGLSFREGAKHLKKQGLL